MRSALSRSRIRFAGALAALLGVAATLASGAPRAHQARAALVLVHRIPVTVRGTGFTPHARARVTLADVQKQVRRPLTSAHGTFTVTFSAVVDRCSGWTVIATQPGRPLVVLHGPKPECPPA